MSKKVSNEITLRVLCDKDTLVNDLLNNGFNYQETFTLDDTYLIDKSLDIKGISTRDILSKCVLLRRVVDDNKTYDMITYKSKVMDENGTILSQNSINCGVKDMTDAANLMEALGYTKLMHIYEEDLVYALDEFNIAIKILDDYLLVELETSDTYDSTDKLLEKLKILNLPLDLSDCFIKKAEIELNKVLNRK